MKYKHENRPGLDITRTWAVIQKCMTSNQLYGRQQFYTIPKGQF